MTLTQIPQPDMQIEQCRHWCSWCGATCYEGAHDSTGRFMQSSVLVTDAEVWAARKGPGHFGFEATRWNIAFGKHIGTFR